MAQNELAISVLVQTNPPAQSTGLCDALLAPHPGELTWPINRRLLSGGLVVTEAEVRCAVRFAFSTLELVVESSGAVGLAALLGGTVSPLPPGRQDSATVVVLSGSNVDPAGFAEMVQEQD